MTSTQRKVPSKNYNTKKKKKAPKLKTLRSWEVSSGSLEGKNLSEALPLLPDSDRLLVIRRSTSSRSAAAAAALEVGAARRWLASPPGTPACNARPAPPEPEQQDPRYPNLIWLTTSGVSQGRFDVCLLAGPSTCSARPPADEWRRKGSTPL